MQIKARLAAWLAPRGLAFNEDKTRVVCLDEGFDFLGFNVRRYRNTPLIRPSKAAVRRIRERLRNELRSLRGHNAGAVIRRLNPIIRGWAAYYRTQVSSQTFKALDQHLWKLTSRWALISCQWPSGSPQLRPSFLPNYGHRFSPLVAIKSPHLGVWGWGSVQGRHPFAGGCLREPVAVLSVGEDHVSVVQEPLDGRGGECLWHQLVKSGGVDV